MGPSVVRTAKERGRWLSVWVMSLVARSDPNVAVYYSHVTKRQQGQFSVDDKVRN